MPISSYFTEKFFLKSILGNEIKHINFNERKKQSLEDNVKLINTTDNEAKFQGIDIPDFENISSQEKVETFFYLQKIPKC